jgi:hypothetical protein
MAVNSATQTKYDQTGIREQLSDQIYNVDPMATPFMTAIGRGPAATNTKVEWQTDTLADATNEAALDGDDASYLTATQTVRPSNYTQIFTKSILVSGTAQAVTTAGRRNELLYQVDKRTKELKRNMEKAFTGNTASEDGSRATARFLGGFETWIESNSSRGSGGTDGGYTTTGVTVAAGDATSTNLRTFTEAMLKSAIKDIWDNSGEHAPLVIVGSFNKQIASSFSGIATQYTDYGNTMSSRNVAILGAADIYVSDFGKHRIVPDHFSRARSALLVNPTHWEARYLRSFKIETLAKTGDADKRQMLAEVTICSKNEKTSGVVADLTTS